jgi:glycosyltransferase involved in cell wall biosynthesis
MWGLLRDFVYIILARLSGASVVSHFRAGRFDLRHDNGALGRFVARVVLRFVNYVAVLGESVRDVFGDLVPSERIRVVPNGIDLAAWPLDDAPAPAKAAGSYHVLYLGNLFHDKGAHVMLRAVPLLVERLPGLRVTFAGQWYDESYRPYCEELVARYSIERYVEFVGPVDTPTKKRLLRNCDVSVFVPVKPEGLPWVVLEAMASARPVIATPQGVIPEVMVDGATGFVVETEDAESLAERILRLASDPEMARQMGASGRRRIEQVYSEHLTHERLAGVIFEAAGHAPPSGATLPLGNSVGKTV